MIQWNGPGVKQDNVSVDIKKMDAMTWWDINVTRDDQLQAVVLTEARYMWIYETQFYNFNTVDTTISRQISS